MVLLLLRFFYYIELMEENLYDKLRIACWDTAFHAFGYSYIFEQRASKYSGRIKLLNIFGIAVPLAVGLTATGYGINNQILKYAIYLAIPLSALQVMVSLSAMGYDWTGELFYAYEASQDFSTISDKFRKLASNPPAEYSELSAQYNLIDADYKNRENQSKKQDIKKWEKRMGMRYALIDKQKECVTCKIIPPSMDSSKCATCGNFSIKYKFLNK